MSQPFEKHVLVCTQEKPDGAPCCADRGGKALLEATRAEVAAAGLATEVLVTGCGCLGLCERGPTVLVYPEGHWYTKLGLGEVKPLVREHLGNGVPLAGRDDPDDLAIRTEVGQHRSKVRRLLAARAEAGVLPDELTAMLRGFQVSRVLLTGVELDVFSAVEGGAAADEVAGRIDADPRATESLLNALAALGILEKRDGRFRNGEWAARYLRAGSPHDSRQALRHNIQLWPSWSTLTDCVRHGTAVAHQEMTERGEVWTEAFIAAMHKNASVGARSVLGAVDLDGVTRVLDLGGGSGAYAMAFARARPELEVTVFDLPTVTPLTRRYLVGSGVETRVHTVEGDLRTDAYGTGFDMAFVSAICHMNDPGENVAMFRKVGDALEPGGRIVIQEFVLNPDKAGPRFGALFALNMLVGTKGGSAYSEGEYAAWLEEAGFAGVRRVELPGPADLIIASVQEGRAAFSD